VAPHEGLLRRVREDDLNDDRSVRSTAFYGADWKPDPSISVDLARLTTPQDSIARANKPDLDLGVVGLVAAVPLGMDLSIRRDPQPGNDAHCLIEGVSTRDQCRHLARACRLVYRPDTWRRVERTPDPP
jgi:hypothetical protein